MCMTENYFSYFSTKTFVVGTQKKRLNETVILSTQNVCYDCLVRKKLHFYLFLKKFCLNGPMILAALYSKADWAESYLV